MSKLLHELRLHPCQLWFILLVVTLGGRVGDFLGTDFYLYDPQASLDTEDVLGRQAIHHAAQAGALGTLECIILEGADVNQPASVNCITPLHYATKVRDLRSTAANRANLGQSGKGTVGEMSSKWKPA